MSRFGDDYNPYGRDRNRFEDQGAFETRRADDYEAHRDSLEDQRIRDRDLMESMQCEEEA